MEQKRLANQKNIIPYLCHNIELCFHAQTDSIEIFPEKEKEKEKRERERKGNKMLIIPR